MSASELGFLRKRPWLFVVAAFVLLITAWTILITIAVNNRPADAPNPLNSGPDPSAVKQGETDGR